MAQQDNGFIDNNIGVQLPGPSQKEGYLIGNEYAQASYEAGSQVPGLTAELPSEDGSQNMGSMGYDGGAPLQGNDQAMRGIPDVVPAFPDVVPVYEYSGYDSMANITPGARLPLFPDDMEHLTNNVLPRGTQEPEQSGATGVWWDVSPQSEGADVEGD